MCSVSFNLHTTKSGVLKGNSGCPLRNVRVQGKEEAITLRISTLGNRIGHENHNDFSEPERVKFHETSEKKITLLKNAKWIQNKGYSDKIQ